MHATTTADLERIRSVTSNYFFWQGLRLVPLGLIIAIFSFKATPWWPLAGAWGDILLFSIVAGAISTSPLIGRYYRRTFGRVRDDPDAHRRRDTMKWFLVYPLMIASLIIDIIFKPLFFITGPVWAAGIMAYWSSTGRGRPHYLVASLCMLGLTAIQWLGFVEPGKQMFSVFGLVLGAIYIIAGLLDHRELCRVLRPQKKSHDGTAV